MAYISAYQYYENGGVAPENVKTSNIYSGVIPFIFIQIFAIILVFAFPAIATWLPRLIN